MNVIIMSLLAGMFGMGLGALLAAVLGIKTDKMTSILLSFSGGVMLSIVFMELVPEAVELSSILITVLGLLTGVLLVIVLHYVMDKTSNKREESKSHESVAEFFHYSDVLNKKPGMLRSGMIMLFAIGLHNIPEGLALGAAGQYEIRLGIALAIIIAMHNIPEGMAVAVPLMVGGLSKAKAVLIPAAVGAVTVIGAVIGVFIGGISDIALALAFSISGGAMLYVVIGEMLPQAILMRKDRIPTIFTLMGIVFGILLIELVHLH